MKVQYRILNKILKSSEQKFCLAASTAFENVASIYIFCIIINVNRIKMKYVDIKSLSDWSNIE